MIGEKGAYDECAVWEVADPLNNQIIQAMVHYDDYVHGLSIEMEQGPRKTLGQHLG